MATEYEATFSNINKKEIRAKLKELGAECVHAERLQKLMNFYVPLRDVEGKTSQRLRVRDEGTGEITLSYKWEENGAIDGQKEIELHVTSFNDAKEFVEGLGAHQKNYQEKKRETWKLDTVTIDIDEWPYVEPFVEIEGSSEKDVREVSEKLGFDYSEALFGNVARIYTQKYDIEENEVHTASRITFSDPNPFQ